MASGTKEIESGPAAVGAAAALMLLEDMEDPRVAMQSVELTTAKAAKYKLWMSRPNVHTVLYYGDVAEEYGLVCTLMVTVFELKHKSVCHISLSLERC